TDKEHHSPCTPKVHASQEITKRRIVRDELQAAISVPRRGDIRGGERDTCDDLHNKGGKRGRAEHIPPVGARRHGVVKYRLGERHESRAVVNPVPYSFENLHMLLRSS